MTGPRTSTRTGNGQPADFYGHPDRACAQTDVEVFYSAADTFQELAKKICKRCPFQQECLKYALDHGEDHGVWGGVLMSAPAERSGARTRLAWQKKTPEQREQQVARLRDPSRSERKLLLEEQVRDLWGQDKPDGTIAMNIGITHGAVATIRRRLNLPALYGPGGKPINREQIPA